ncbi:MAG TPA: hypothetical protein VLK65_17560 [Vicinamibacteria bacterium]|nr:hypothetical protein [Vicinamibacteria bacterium]
MTAALGLWISSGEIATVNDGEISTTLALLPSLTWLLFLIAATVLVVTKLSPSTIGWSPFLFTAILLLPWIPLPLPDLTKIWTGHLVGYVWLSVVVTYGVALGPRVLRQPALVLRPRHAALVAGMLAVLCYGVGASSLASRLPGGDEPHYLVITQSLLHDLDLRIENNHDRLDFLEYYDGRLDPHYLRRGRDGVIYSVHAPGLPLFVAPAFLLAGYRGVVIFLILVAAAATTVVWRLAHRLTGDPGAAWFGWAGSSLTVPFFLHSFQIYPDAPAAALVLLGVSTWCFPPNTRVGLALHSLPVVFLPWLHWRYAVLALVLGAFTGYRLLASKRPPSQLACFLLCPAVSLITWFGYFQILFGSPEPWAPYGRLAHGETIDALTGLGGLVFDQQFGLLPYAPVLLLVPLGWLVLVRRDREGSAISPKALAIGLITMSLGYLCQVSFYEMWWGGASAPGRFATPVVLAFGLPLAVAWKTLSGPSQRLLASMSLAVSLSFTGILAIVDRGRLVFNDRDGASLLLEWLSGLVRIDRVLPSFFRDDAKSAFAGAAIWLFFFALLGAIAYVLDRRGKRSPMSTLGVLTAGALAVMLAGSQNWRGSGGGLENKTGSELALLASAPRQSIGITYSPFRVETPAEVVEKLSIQDSSHQTLYDYTGGPSTLFLRNVPAGRYLIDTEPRASRDSIAIGVGRPPPWLRHNSLGPAARSSELVLPVDVSRMHFVRSNPNDRLFLRPIARIRSAVSGRAQQAALFGETEVYFMDENAYPEQEGFWVTSSRTARLWIPAAATGRSMWVVRNAPVRNIVTLRWNDGFEKLELEPREQRVVTLPLSAPGLELEVFAQRGFHPIRVDPSTRDYRALGCWLETYRGP